MKKGLEHSDTSIILSTSVKTRKGIAYLRCEKARLRPQKIYKRRVNIEWQIQILRRFYKEKRSSP